MDNNQIKDVLIVVCIALMALNQLLTTLRLRQHAKLWNIESQGKVLELAFYKSLNDRLERLERNQSVNHGLVSHSGNVTCDRCDR